MKCRRVKPHGAVQSLEQRNVLGDIIVLPSDPLCDSDCAVSRAVDYHPNTRWAIHEASTDASTNWGSLTRGQLFDIRLTNLDDPDPHHRIKTYMHSGADYFGNEFLAAQAEPACAQVVEPE